MITIFNRAEVYHGFSMEECVRIRDILSMNQIKYTYKSVSNKGPAFFISDHSTMGCFGEDMKHAYMYYVYVHKDNAELAFYAINQNKQR